MHCKKNLLPDRAIVQILPVRLLPALGGIDRRPAAHLGRASEKSPEDLEDEELETGPFAHGFRDDPAGVGVVDDDFSLLGGRGGDLFGYFLDGEHFEEFGEVVSVPCVSRLRKVVDGVGGFSFTGHPSWPSSRLREPRRNDPLCARGIAS